MSSVFDQVQFTPDVQAYLYEPAKEVWTVTVDTRNGLRQYSVSNSELPVGWQNTPVKDFKQVLKDAIIAQGS